MYAVLFVAALVMHPNHEISGCETLPWHGTDTVYLSESPVALDIVRTLREAGDIEMEIVACDSLAGSSEGSMPMPESQTHNDADGVSRGYVHIPSMVLAEFSEAALRGVIAHEVAHLVLPESMACTVLPVRLDRVTNEEYAACETPADSRAAQWTDRDAVTQFLLEITALLHPYMKEDEKKHALFHATLRLRLKAITE